VESILKPNRMIAIGLNLPQPLISRSGAGTDEQAL
jgi:hypothetical protein